MDIIEKAKEFLGDDGRNKVVLYLSGDKSGNVLSNGSLAYLKRCSAPTNHEKAGIGIRIEQRSRRKFYGTMGDPLIGTLDSVPSLCQLPIDNARFFVLLLSEKSIRKQWEDFPANG